MTDQSFAYTVAQLAHSSLENGLNLVEAWSSPRLIRPTLKHELVERAGAAGRLGQSFPGFYPVDDVIVGDPLEGFDPVH